MRQLLLDFTRAPEPTFENFVPGGNGELLHALDSAVGGRPAERVVYLWGESGAGKTHLAHAFRRAVEGRRGVRVIDGVETLDEAAQAELFNAFVDRAFAFLLATARCAPRDLALRRDLATRLASGLAYRVLPLTDEQKREALAAHARTRGFELSDEVASYLLTHARRDMGSLMSALDAIDQYSLETRKPVTVPLLKAAMTPTPSLPQGGGGKP
ncbi:MAG TPA: DnaA/Hda family protein [Usitatibacter sp.]|nr:DnaA/Hda family protein [Usitatibacter sp.]